MTLEQIYNIFANSDFCEVQDVVIRIHSYKDEELYYEENENSDAYVYEFADTCDSFRFAELYNNKEFRENKFKQYENEFECTTLKTVFDESLIAEQYREVQKALCDTTIIINCDYVI